MNPDTSFFIELVGNLGSLGFILWLVWRTTNHTIPRLAKGFEDNIKEARTDFKELLNKQRDDFRISLNEQRQAHKNEIDTIIDLVRKENGK